MEQLEVMKVDYASIGFQQPTLILSLEALTQTPTAASRVMIVPPTTQSQPSPISAAGVLPELAITPMEYDPDLTRPRVSGSGKDRILRIAHDFDAAFDW